MNDSLAHQGWISDVLGDWLNLSEEFGMQYLVAQAEKVRGTHVLPVSLFI